MAEATDSDGSDSLAAKSSANSTSARVEEKLNIDIREVIQNCGDGLLLPDRCIYKVPITLRHLKKEVYTPKVVSIGPFHYGNKRLQDMERHKPVLFKTFIERAVSNLDDLVCLVEGLEPKVRASYSETINLTKQQLVNLTLVDAGFIIELFIMSCVTFEQGIDAKLSQEWLKGSIIHDLLLLENQLPFFVIEELFNKAFPNQNFRSSLPYDFPCQDFRGNLPSIVSLSYTYFGYYKIQQFVPNPHVKIKHFTDLLRLFYLQGSMPEREPIPKDGSHILSYKAIALQEAGVKLRKLKDSESKSYLDLKLSGHILEIPQIEVDDYTELLFRNMIALEQCHYPYHAYITDYALLLDGLIDTNKDVDLLIHKEIVRNYLGDTKNVASLINGLSDNVVQLNFNSDFVKICKDLNKYCADPWHKLKATLKHDYCRTPWQTVTSIAAIVLLFLTVAQTVFSILQVVN